MRSSRATSTPPRIATRRSCSRPCAGPRPTSRSSGRIGVAVQLSGAVIERLRQRVQGPDNQGKLAAALTNAMFGGETLELVLKRLREDPTPLDAFVGVLSSLGPNEFPTVLSNLREATNPQLRGVLASFIERYMAGREQEIAAAVPGSDPDVVVTLIQLLSRAGSAGARQALSQLAQSEDVNVRIEARVLTAPSAEHAQQELGALLDNTSALVRMAALRAVHALPDAQRLGHRLAHHQRQELQRARQRRAPRAAPRRDPALARAR